MLASPPERDGLRSRLRPLAKALGVAAGFGSVTVCALVIWLRGLLSHPQAMIFVVFSLAGALMMGIGVRNAIHPTARVITSHTTGGFARGHRRATWLDGLRTALLGVLFCVLAVVGDLLIAWMR